VSSHNGAAADNLAEPAAIQFIEETPPHAGLAEQGIPAEEVDRFSGPPHSSAREPARPFAVEREERSAQPGGLEPPGTPPLPTERAHADQAAEKPANPRKGWWQRLIQS
jgi:hypothetical protein